jgi:dTDP-glucose 4,6-dehydratase
MTFIPHGLLVTGGAGFIGSNFVRFFLEQHPDVHVVVLDALTYAGNLANLADLENKYTFVHGDIRDAGLVRGVLDGHSIDTIVHFAAESHVDRSILGPLVFTETNIHGTHVLLEEGRQRGIQRFVHVSTDEVYGSLGAEGRFTEESPLNPTSPYAASKAASDLLVHSYARTFGFPAMITRCSNNYGPRQFPEKLIPLMLINAMSDKPLPVYGDGLNVRDWIHVRDHADALIAVLQRGQVGRVYNIGSDNEWPNIDIVRLILRQLEKPEDLISFVTDRPAHDRRYAIDSARIQQELGWMPAIGFEQGIADTICLVSRQQGLVGTRDKRSVSGLLSQSIRRGAAVTQQCGRRCVTQRQRDRFTLSASPFRHAHVWTGASTVLKLF